MFLTDLSIKRPVVASVMSLVLVIFGLVTFQEIPTDELPDVQPPVVTIQTEYKQLITIKPIIRLMQKVSTKLTEVKVDARPAINNDTANIAVPVIDKDIVLVDNGG